MEESDSEEEGSLLYIISVYAVVHKLLMSSIMTNT